MNLSRSASYAFLYAKLWKYSDRALENAYSPIKYISCFIVAAPFEYVIPSNMD